MMLYMVVIAGVIGKPCDALAQKKSTVRLATPKLLHENVSPIGKSPKFKVGQDKHIHVWFENDVWHFRCTTGIVPRQIDGIVTVDKGQVQIVGGEGQYEELGPQGKLTNAKEAGLSS